MIINIEPGEVLKVQFIRANSELEIHFDTDDYPNDIVVKETRQGLDDGVIFQSMYD